MAPAEKEARHKSLMEAEFVIRRSSNREGHSGSRLAMKAMAGCFLQKIQGTIQQIHQNDRNP